MHPTPLHGRKVVAILKSGGVLTAFPSYHGGVGDGQAVRPKFHRSGKEVCPG
jgi:hypothetical protein